MKVLLVDNTQYAPSSPLFAEALARTGLEHEFFDEKPYLEGMNRLSWKLAYRALRRRTPSYWRMNADLLGAAERLRPDVVLVCKGQYVAPRTLRLLKSRYGSTLVNFATDDPFNPTVYSPALVGGIPLYDLYACTKRAIIPDVLAAGSPNAEFFPFAYKREVHFREASPSAEEVARFSADVAFIGGCDADRIPYFEALASVPGLNIKLYGNYWSKIPSLRRFAGGSVYGREYRLAIGLAKVNVGLVRRANRDGHSMRSFEIPACGGFLLAESTDEHRSLFVPHQAAGFFSTPSELVAQTQSFLRDHALRRSVAARGHRLVTEHRHSYDARLAELLAAAEEIAGARNPARHASEPAKRDSDDERCRSRASGAHSKCEEGPRGSSASCRFAPAHLDPLWTRSAGPGPLHEPAAA